MASPTARVPRSLGHDPPTDSTRRPSALPHGAFAVVGAGLLAREAVASAPPRGACWSAAPLSSPARAPRPGGARPEGSRRAWTPCGDPAGPGSSCSSGSRLMAVAAALCAAQSAELCLRLRGAAPRRSGRGRAARLRTAPRQAVSRGTGPAPAPRGVSIAGSGSAVPATVVSNDDLSEIIETSDEWIAQRTGIRRRRVLRPEETLASLSAEAARAALERAGMEAGDVDLVILATSTPDDLFGSAPAVAAELGASSALAFDLTAACSGFVFGLTTAAQYIRSGAAGTALVIGADCMSRWVDWSDRTTCVLFGDGAGAVALRATDLEKDALVGFELRSDGNGGKHLGLGSCPSAVSLGGDRECGAGAFSPVAMNGKEVFRFATSRVPEVLGELLARHEVAVEDVDWLLLHQANRRIMDSAAKRLKLPKEKIICNVDEYGNTSAGSIPIALDEAIRDGRVKPGDLVACAGFGAGLSWGGMLLRL